MILNHKQLKVLKAIFDTPTHSNIAWEEIENLVVMQCGWCRGNPCGCPLRVRVATFVGNHKGCPYQENHPHCITTENLFRACGAEIIPVKGSRLVVILNRKRAVFHRPHPRKETDKGAVTSVRKFLTQAGVVPNSSDTE